MNIYTGYIALHPIASFNGMNNPSNPAMEWPQIDDFGVITTNASTGKAVRLVGYIKNAYMNQLACSLSVNGGKRIPMVFYQNYGKWASRYVDRDGDNRITDNDWPGGSWFFTPDISCYMLRGKNDVMITVKPASDEHPISVTNRHDFIAKATVICGKQLRIFEADATGEGKKREFLNRPMRWDITGGQAKSVYVGITDPVTRYPGTDGVWIVSGEPADSCDPPIETMFNEAYDCSIIDPGEFCAMENPSMAGHTLVRFKLDPSLLRTEDSDVTTVQRLHFCFYDDSTSELLHEYIPFYIDNDNVQINVFSPPLNGDYNGDGVVDSSDSCATDNDALPASCDSASVCGGFGLTPEECDSAIASCNYTVSDYPEFRLPDCDGVDNDFDGAIDAADDISEMSAIEYYSPRFTAAGKLVSRPVYSRFTISDNLQELFDTPKKLEIRVYKISGYSFNPGADQLLFAEDHGSEGSDSTWRYGEISFTWPFVDNQGGVQFDSLNPPPDGLYCMVVTGCDEAGDTGTADEVVSAPAYFIVDRTPPSMTILSNWHDPDNDDQPVIQTNTERFFMSYRPGPAGLSGTFSDRFDSETEDVTAYFHLLPDLINIETNVAVGYYTVNSIPSYQDKIINSVYLNESEGFQGSDGQLDPTTCYIESKDYSNPDLPVIRKMLVPALPTGQYTVEYVLRDKAGNVTVVHDEDFVITVQRGEDFVGAKEDGRIGRDVESDVIYDDNTGGGELIGENPNSDDGNPSTDDGLAISYVPVTGPISFAIKINSMTSTGSSYAGLIDVRKSLISNDISVTLELNNEGYVVFSWRNIRDEVRTVVDSVYVGRTYNVWLWLVRDAYGRITAYYSLDGINYSTLRYVNFGTFDVIMGTGFRQFETTAPGVLNFTIVHPTFVYWNRVQPALNGVVNNCDGTYTASFGYNNPNSSSVVLQYGSRNSFTYHGASLDVPACPAIFESGNHSNVFTVDFDGTALSWNLDGATITAYGVPSGCEPIIIPSTISGYAVYGFNQVDMADRTELICGSGKCATASGTGLGVTVGVQGKVKSIESRGPVMLRNYANCSDFIKSASSVTLQHGATCPSIMQYYTFPAGVLPSSLATSNIDFTGVPHTDIYVNSYQTKTLAPGKYWNYTCRANGKLKLSAGTYYFHNLHMENNSIIECNVNGGPVKIFIQNYYYSGATCNLVGGNASKVLYGYLGTNTVTVDKLKGTLIAPKATIEAGGWARTFYGQLIGKNVITRPDCKLYYLPFTE